MLHLARKIERDELIAEYRRLGLLGLDNDRTHKRLAVACVVLCGQQQGAIRLYHLTGCDLLTLGADLWDALASAHGAALDDLLAAALAALREAAEAEDAATRKRAQEAAQALKDEEDVREAEAIGGAPLLPPGFRMGRWTLANLARASATMPGDQRIALVRQAFGAAIEAHREGRLGEWMDAFPDAGAIWPGRP